MTDVPPSKINSVSQKHVFGSLRKPQDPNEAFLISPLGTPLGTPSRISMEIHANYSLYTASDLEDVGLDAMPRHVKAHKSANIHPGRSANAGRSSGLPCAPRGSPGGSPWGAPRRSPGGSPGGSLGGSLQGSLKDPLGSIPDGWGGRGRVGGWSWDGFTYGSCKWMGGGICGTN
jgi:hypothetical protein